MKRLTRYLCARRSAIGITIDEPEFEPLLAGSRCPERFELEGRLGCTATTLVGGAIGSVAVTFIQMVAGPTVSFAVMLPLATLVAVWWRESQAIREEISHARQLELRTATAISTHEADKIAAPVSAEGKYAF